MFIILEDETTTAIERITKLYSETNRVHAVTLTHVGNKMVHGTRRNVFAAVIEYYPNNEGETQVTT